MRGTKEILFDLSEFEGLFRKEYRPLCLLAQKWVQDEIIADELVQLFFIALWEKRQVISISSSFDAYAYRSIKNRCIDYLRRKDVADRRNAQLPLLSDTYDPQEESINQLNSEMQHKKMLDLLNKLPYERRRIFILHALDEMSYKEIAATLDISVNTVKTQLRRSYSVLRKVVSLIFVFFYYSS